MQKGSQALAIEGGKNTHSVHKEKAIALTKVWPRAARKGNTVAKPDPGQQKGMKCPSAGEPCRASTFLAS